MPEIEPHEYDPQHPTAEMLLWAYAQGVFPMADVEANVINWYCPEQRGQLPLDGFKVRKSLARVVRKETFEIRCDTEFETVIRACADERREGSWINERLTQAYLQLFEAGHVHCLEAWRDSRLVGGLYGVHIGAAFFGESMFSLPEQGGTDASKVCLVHLVKWLKRRGVLLLDTQYWNPHLQQFGCIELPRALYLAQLDCAIRQPATWGHFQVLDDEDE